MKRRLIWILVLSLLLSALSGCAARTEEPSGQGSTEQSEEAAQPEASADAEPSGSSEVEETAAIETETETQELLALTPLGLQAGGLIPFEEEEKDVEALSEEGQNELDRAMRAYTPGGDTLLVNNAKEFYYYQQMTKDEQSLYDCMLMVAEDPTTTDNIIVTTVSVDPRSPEFMTLYTTAFFGLLYDHAELFWLYNESEASIVLSTPFRDDAPEGKYSIYIQLDRVYENYEKEMKAFNEAAEAFLKDIDLTQEAAYIAKEIHDKLTDLVTYDTAVLEQTGKEGGQNLAHTAYGALVADSEGNPNYAVCDGYSQAYVYLLQQCGINAAVIVGKAGENALKAGGHAWSVVQIDEDWYEVDATWDDIGSLEEEIEALKDVDEVSYAYYKEAIEDLIYREKLRHYLFFRTTEDMNTYVLEEDLYYVSKDRKYIYALTGDSVHQRADETMLGYKYYARLMSLAPVAVGTLYEKLNWGSNG